MTKIYEKRQAHERRLPEWRHGGGTMSNSAKQGEESDSPAH